MNNKNFWKEIIGDLEHSTEEIFKYFGYIKNEEDIKRIEEINSLIGNIKNYENYKFSRIPKLFSKNEIGYTTPKLRVEIFAFNKKELVLEKDKYNNLILPSNWVEQKLSVKESSIKYFKEYFNLELKPEKILSVNKNISNDENIIEISIIGKVSKIHNNCIFLDYNEIIKDNRYIQNYNKIIEIINNKI